MGVIGIGLGVHKAQIINDSGCWYGFPYGNMNGIDGSLIGWWDATDPTTLYQDVAGTTPVTAAGQKVHRIENKAISTDKLGNFVVIRSPGVSAALIPEYQEGGLNENSHLKILANSKGYYSSKAAGAGGVTDGAVFSNATINNQAITTFTVINTGTQTATNVNTKPAFASYGEVSGVEQPCLQTSLEGANQNWESRTTVDNTGTTDTISNTNFNDADEALGILVTTVNGVGATSEVRLNGGAITEVVGTIDPQADFVMADGRITLCGNCQDDTCAAMDTGFLEGTQWYEQIVFNIKLTKEQIKCVEDYLMNKYDIMPVWGDLVGWWDFSNIDSLYQDVGAFTSPITTDGQTIGTVKNLALGDSNGDRLGSFLRAWADDPEYKPVFKTGGRNAQTYAQFNEVSDVTNQKRMLFGGGMQGSVDFTTTGGESVTLFSDLVLNNQAQTVFVVWENDLNDYNDGQPIYKVSGHDASGAAGDSNIDHFRSYTEGNHVHIYTSTGIEIIQIPDIAHNDADHHFTMFKLSPDVNGSFVKTDWVQEATGTTTNQICDFDTNSQTGAGTPSVQLGGQSPNVGIYNALDMGPWVGRIYEVLHYARTLTDGEISEVENYLNVKYAPGPSTFITNELVGWWDFTDNESMFQSNAGATAVLADNDPIGRINNKADGDLLGNKMGQFLRSYADTAAYRPTYKTGGVNGHSYGEFGLGANTGLRGGYFTGDDCDVNGGVSATKFSDLKLNCTDQTIYAVVERTGASTGQADILYTNGLDGVGTGSAGLLLTKSNGAAAGYAMSWFDQEGGVLNYELMTELGLPTGLNVIKIVGNNTASMILDGVLEDTEVIEDPITLDLSLESAVTNPLNGAPIVSLGNQIATGATDGETGSTEWIGKIYEVFVWNKTLNADEQADMDTYLINKYGQIGNIVPVSEAVGHWDFTEISTLHQNVNGTTDVTADGDRIGHVLNLAPGDANGDKLGTFLNAPADTNVRPTYKTGGINSKSYAKFNEGDDLSCLRGGNFDGVDSTTTGGVSADVFSYLDYNVTERTIFMMVKCDDVDASTVEYLFQLYGTDPGWDIVSRREYFAKYPSSGADPNTIQYFRYDNSGQNFPMINPIIYTDSPLSDQATLISSRNASGGTYGDLQVWFDTSIVEDTWNWYTFPTYIDLEYGTNAYNRPTVSMGAYTPASGVSATNKWDGDIYEIIVFNRTLTDDEMSQMNTYFQTKYALDFNTPVLPTISEHVGHWDFTDASSLKQLRNNTTAVAADGDPIGRVNNLAPGDASGDKLGAFLRAGADDTTRPTYKTDGIMGKSYAKFESVGGGGQLLRGGFFSSADADDDGGETATNFSDLLFKQLESTIFIVAKTSISEPATSQRMLFIKGYEDGSGSGSAYFTARQFGAVNYGAQVLLNKVGDSVAEIVGGAVPMGTDTHLFQFTNSATDISIDQDGSNIASATPNALWSVNPEMHFENNLANGNQQVSIGGYADSDGTDNSVDEWNGDIYEILVYNKVLSADEITQIEAYISAKYSITIS